MEKEIEHEEKEIASKGLGKLCVERNSTAEERWKAEQFTALPSTWVQQAEARTEKGTYTDSSQGLELPCLNH